MATSGTIINSDEYLLKCGIIMMVIFLSKSFYDLLNLEYKDMQSGFKRASVEGYGTPQEISDRREQLVHNFFQKYFPFPYRIVKGNINDSYGKRSKSIDCIILNPAHPYTIDQNNKKASFIFADGVDFAIEVKGKMDSKREIERALDQIKSVKDLTRKSTGIISSKQQEDYLYKIPVMLIAESTYSNVEKLIDHIVEYYKKNRIKRIHQFDIILVDGNVILNSYKLNPYSPDFGIEFCNYGDFGLGLLLFLMTYYPQSHPKFNREIIKYYFGNILGLFNICESQNKILKEIENSDNVETVNEFV